MSTAKSELDVVKAHPKYLALVIFRYLHVLDTDNLFIGKHSLVLCWELLSRFSGFMFVPILSFALAAINQYKANSNEPTILRVFICAGQP